MKPRKSKKNKALAVDLQKQASLFASTAHLFMGEMYNMCRSQGLQLVALEFGLHLTIGCPAGGLGPACCDTVTCLIQQFKVNSQCPYSAALRASLFEVHSRSDTGQCPPWGLDPLVCLLSEMQWFPVCNACAEGFECSLGCGLTRSTGSAGEHAFSGEAKCSLH